MTALPKTIRQSELAGRLVILRDSMEELGHVDVVWMHPPVHRVFGFICSSGFLGRKKSAFNLPQLHTIGEDGILVNSAPVPTDAQKVRQIESLLGYELWTDSGEKVGQVVDYMFDTETGAIKAYLFTSHPLGALTDGLYKLTPRQMLSYGDRRIRVRNQVLESPELYQPGLKQKIATVGESVRESVEDEWRSLTEQASTFREQTLEQWQSLAEQAKNKVVPQAKDKAQVFKEQGLGFVDRLREQTQSYTEHLRTEFDSWNLNPDEWPTAERRTGEYQWDDRAADALWEDDSADSEDEFEDELNDWGKPDASSTAATLQSEITSKLAEPEDDDDDDDAWDTWDLDESPAPTPEAPDETDDGEWDTWDLEESPSSAHITSGEVEEDNRLDGDSPEAVLPPPETVTDQDSRDDSDQSVESTGEDGAAINSQAETAVQTEPIPSDDLEDDDPWV